MLQKHEITHGKHFDFSLSIQQKQMLAGVVGLLSGVIWLFYSTPNTIDLCTRFARYIKVLNWVNGGIVLMITAGLAFSIGEYVFLGLYAWKRKLWMLAGLFICGAVSVMASAKFINVGNQLNQIKQATVSSKANLVEQTRLAIIDEQKNIQQYIERAQGYELRGFTPPLWVDRRRREAVERKDGLLARLERLSNDHINTANDIGATISFDNEKYGFIGNWLIPLFLEAMLIAFGWISIGLYDTRYEYVHSPTIKLTNNQETNPYLTDEKYVAVDSVNSGDNTTLQSLQKQLAELHATVNCKLSQTPAVAQKIGDEVVCANTGVNKLSTVNKKSQVTKDHPGSKKQQIIALSTDNNYRHENGRPKITKIADKIGCSRQHVQNTLKYTKIGFIK